MDGSGSHGVDSPLSWAGPSALKMALLHGWMPAVAKISPAFGRVRILALCSRMVEILTILLCQLKRLASAGEIGTSHHEFRATNFMSPLHDAFQIIRVLLRAMVAASEYRVG